jgi:exonuclease SbcD
MLDAQASFIDHLVETVRAENVDVIVVAGDVYDRALPSVDVVSVLDDALVRLAATGAHVVLTSGNHDSARRLGFGARILESGRVHVRTDPSRCAEPVVVDDAWGPVAIYPLPYLEPTVVAGTLRAEHTDHEGVLGAAMDAVRADAADRATPSGGPRSVVAAHAFVVGGEPSDSERDISVGGVASVPLGVFDGPDYVALGHLHGRQRLSDRVRYSGSPLPYSFSEHRQVKGSWLVELDRNGLARVDAVPAPVHRPLAVLRGSLEQLLTDPAHAVHASSFCQVTLTDQARPENAMNRLRNRFPHAVELRFAPGGPAASRAGYAERVRGRSDLEVCCGFLDHVRGRGASDGERALFADALTAVRTHEAEAG